MKKKGRKTKISYSAVNVHLDVGRGRINPKSLVTKEQCKICQICGIHINSCKFLGQIVPKLYSCFQQSVFKFSDATFFLARGFILMLKLDSDQNLMASRSWQY